MGTGEIVAALDAEIQRPQSAKALLGGGAAEAGARKGEKTERPGARQPPDVSDSSNSSHSA
jgi:hypothetical protein